jgi:hypothetical protein
VRKVIRVALANLMEAGVETTWSIAGPISGDADWAGGGHLPRREASSHERSRLISFWRRVPGD